MRTLFLLTVPPLTLLALIGGFYTPALWYSLFLLAPLTLLGIYDVLQKDHTILRNFPILGHFRYLFEMIRPEISQYFIETDSSGRPFNREQRSIIYQRAKRELQTLPFGTKQDTDREGYRWIAHSLAPKHVKPNDLRITIGGEDCTQPYSASILNISAMSFGSLSRNAVLALNSGARMGNFAHNTGEGGLSPYHLEPGGDLIWQIGTGYFGCRDREGGFDPNLFQQKANLPQVKMIEIKLSQGAKPGHGGILPAEKLTEEIAEIRGVPMNQDVLSPSAHSAFSTPMELMAFVARLRELSNGKPVGFKLCIGESHEFFALCKAMIRSKILPDFITVDGGEGGTGAAPLEFSNHVGMPLEDALSFVQNTLSGFGLRHRLKVIASGKIVSGFDVINKVALGADLVNSARAMMMAIGCIQALRCHSNHCPTGVATQNPELVKGLVVRDKAPRVADYHHETLRSTAELLGAMGLEHLDDVRPRHIYHRLTETEVVTLASLFPTIPEGCFLQGEIPEKYAAWYAVSSPDTFRYQAQVQN